MKPFYLGALITLLVIIKLWLWFTRRSFKEKRHRYKIKKAKAVLKKFEGFKGEFKNAQIITYLRKIDPYVFEELLLEAYEIKGYTIKRNKSYSHDGGIDGLIYNPNNQKILIQAKRYKQSIQSKHIHVFSDQVNSNNASAGYFIHTGKTPTLVFNQYRNTNISIISGSKLVELITTTTRGEIKAYTLK